MAYLTEAPPPHGVPLPVLPGVRRIVADNPGPMTYHGTNTLLIDGEAGTLVLDPGPDDAAHLEAVAGAADDIAAILLSHGHQDHCAGAGRLAEMLGGVPVFGHPAFRSGAATIDRPLEDGMTIGGLAVLYTPGHAPDHLCFARGDGVLFTGDHVMGWSSSVVPFPSGDMGAFIRNLERVRDRGDRVLVPGHGPVIAEPAPFVDELIGNRLRREEEIVALVSRGPTTVDELTHALYAQRGPQLFVAARHNVLAHLAKLGAEGRAVGDGDLWRMA